jgi:hypothetical protein
MAATWRTKKYMVTCPSCNQEREVGREAHWHIVSPKGRSTGDCKSCSLRKKTYPNRKNPGNDRAAISDRMKGNSYAKGLKRSQEFIEANRERMIGNKLRLGYTGNKVGTWKGGISTADRLERLKFRREMQAKIFFRDNYTCQICDEYGGKIQVDHIKKWSEYPELRFVESNCRTLCMACHYYITFKRVLPKGQVWGHNLNKLDRIED